MYMYMYRIQGGCERRTVDVFMDVLCMEKEEGRRTLYYTGRSADDTLQEVHPRRIGTTFIYVYATTTYPKVPHFKGRHYSRA